MSANSYVRHVFLFVALMLDLFQEVFSEYCGDNKYCQTPYKCCANSQACCYDEDSSRYTRGFKLHVWNMWYFWLVIIFVLMSCFGGCGYYRRRRIAALQQTPSQSPARSCASRFRRHHNPAPDYYAYTGPGANATPDILHLPPPYTEVMQQPGLYPVNKMELPPYPGPPEGAKDEESGTLYRPETANPPPYSEVAQTCTVYSEVSNSHSSSPAVQPTESSQGSNLNERNPASSSVTRGAGGSS